MKAMSGRGKFLVGVPVILALAVILSLGLALPAQANGNITVTIQANGSAGSPLSGVAISYLDGYWRGIGNTNSSGQVSVALPSGTWDFKAAYGGTVAQQTQDISISGTVTFYTSEAKVVVKQSDGSTALSGVAVSYLAGYYRGIGNTDGSGIATMELFPGTYTFKAAYGGTSATQSMNLAGDGVSSGSSATITFYTSKARVEAKESDGSPLSGVGISYLAGYDRGIGNTDANGVASAERFPGTYTFKASYGGTSATQDMNLAGDGLSSGQSSTITFYTSEAEVEVKTSGDSPLSGVAVSYLAGYYRGIGNTDGSGVATMELFPGTYTFKAAYGGTSATQDMVLAGNGLISGQGSSMTFHTSEARVEGKDCGGTPVSGVGISYLAGYYRGIGNTDGSGIATMELFPGTYTFRAAYGGTSATQDMVLAGDGLSSGQSTTITFNPTKVTLQYSGSKAYLAGYWRGFSGPIYMFPGTYTFKFDGIQQDMTIGGCEVTSSVLVIRLKDSTGAMVAGGNAYLGVGGWPYIGTTDASGVLLYFHSGLLGTVRIQMAAPNCGGSETSPYQDTTVNSVYDFQTSRVVIQLKDSAGTLTDGGVVAAGCGGWPGIGTTGTDGTGTLYHEHFAGVFKYRMSFNGTTEEQQHDVSIPFVFQTIQAVIQLKDHLENLTDGGVVRFGIGGWPVIGTTGDGGTGQVTRELFAGSYNFRMTYNYGTQEKNQDVSIPVVFQTVEANARLLDCDGNGVAGGIASYAQGTWVSLGTTDADGYSASKELLPASYKFGLTYAGETQIHFPVVIALGGDNQYTEVFQASAVCNPPNSPPAAKDDSLEIDEDTMGDVNVLENDEDVDLNLDPSSIQVIGDGPSAGLLTNCGDGTFTYTPAPDSSGSYSFFYQVCDTEGDCDTATVSITVWPVNDPPIAADDSFSGDEDADVTGSVLVDNGGGADSDVDGNLDANSVTRYGDPTNGTLTLASDGTFTYTPDPDYNGGDSFAYQVCDTEWECDTATVYISVQAVNDAPVLDVDNEPVNVDEGQTAGKSGTVSDVDGDEITLAASVGIVTKSGDGAWIWSYTTEDGPEESQKVIITADDGRGGTSCEDFELTVNNVAPTVGPISAPTEPVMVGTEVGVSAGFSDPGIGDTPSAKWHWGDGVESLGTIAVGTVSGSHTYDEAGVYTIRLDVNDDDGGSGQSVLRYVVVYDPYAGFITGGGWIDSPEGACRYDACTNDTTGKATFGFVSKYKKGAHVPTGNTEFQFKAGNLNFHSSSYQWLVVAGAKAKFKGEGTINGMGRYGFLISAIDAKLTSSTAVDLFRIKIWDTNNGDFIVYDNQMGAADDADPTTVIGGGSIVIHSEKK